MLTDLRVAVIQRLHGANQRVTRNREALVEILSDASRPMTLPEILKERPTLAQSSAYRNLLALEQANVVRRVGGVDEFARFELAEDLTEHHHHLICDRCGAVEDVDAPPGLESAVDKAVAEIEVSHGFLVRHHRVDLVGTCATCASIK